MEYGTIERELHIEASPDVVYQVVSSPEHLKEWWPDEAALDPSPGGTGVIAFGEPDAPNRHVVPITVVEADPPRRFSFRWVYDGEVAPADDSLLVTFDLVPSGTGTLLRFSEAGFREKGWEAAVLEQQYNEHVEGWNYYLPRLVSYAGRLVRTA
jgi:uncharacterized protein YndB with AHSA1/START domain